MLGRLVTYLRMCGHDTAAVTEEGLDEDAAISAFARDENRRLLTRDRDLAARTPGAVLLTARDIEGQLAEVSEAGLDLSLPEEPRRCSACNGDLRRVPAGTSTPEYAPDPAETAVWRCVDCAQRFWMGSHWDDIADRLAAVTDSPTGT